MKLYLVVIPVLHILLILLKMARRVTFDKQKKARKRPATQLVLAAAMLCLPMGLTAPQERADKNACWKESTVYNGGHWPEDAGRRLVTYVGAHAQLSLLRGTY